MNMQLFTVIQIVLLIPAVVTYVVLYHELISKYKWRMLIVFLLIPLRIFFAIAIVFIPVFYFLLKYIRIKNNEWFNLQKPRQGKA